MVADKIAYGQNGIGENGMWAKW